MHLIENGFFVHLNSMEVFKDKMIGRFSQSNRKLKSISKQKSNSDETGYRDIKLDELLRGVLLIWFSGIIFSILMFVLNFITK